MFNLALTSDFPSTANEAVVDWMMRTGPKPRVAWIPPETEAGRQHFAAARQLFDSYNLRAEYCDIDQEPDERQLARLAEYEVIYLTGGDPIAFRRNIRRIGLGTRLQECLAPGRLIVGASGGSMQLTKNVSLFRLVATGLDVVVAEQAEFAGLGLVRFEVLPHLNRFEASFVDSVRQYSEQVPHDILACRHLARGA